MSIIEAYDAETVEVAPQVAGRPVDPPVVATTWADITSRDVRRAPIVPAWLRSREQRWATLKAIAGTVAYAVAFHATRVPKYLLKVALYAPVGAWRIAARVLMWTAAEQHNWHLRQQAANNGDAYTWQQLNRTRSREAKARTLLVGSAALLLAVALLVVYLGGWVPPAGWWAASVALVLLFARAGRPADRPITDRVVTGPRFVKLTAEMVRGALCSIGIPAIKDPASVTFPDEIHRDGPGWLARVNLPAGVEAVEVLERRGRLSSALRLPIDQVWPTVGPDHAGQLDLWVGRQPASKMAQPKWSLAADTARTSVFEPVEIGTDQRMRPVKTPLFARNFLIGGVPGSGKSYAARALAIAAALDPTCELRIAELKGTADFGDLADVCSSYVCGVDEQSIAAAAGIIAWGLAEAERRGERIRKARERGEAPEGKVTPELAARPGSGLHPVLILVDEAHELFGDTTVGKDAAIAAERLIKRGRALGIIVVLATQIPDRTSLPPAITRCVNMRWCLAVQDQVANDMILGTGAYKRGLSATVYRPGLDAGWGILTGLAEPTPVRSQYPDPGTTAAIIARAAALRGGVVGDQDAERVQARDMLADARAVLRPGESGLPWAVLAERLAETWPEFYAGITPEMVRESLARYGVQSQDVKASGRNLKGARRTALDAAEQRRQIEA